MFSEADILGVDSSWILRNDGSYLLLYKLGIDDNRTWVLNPLESYILSLVDGSTPYGALVHHVQRVFALPHRQTAKSVLDTHLAAFRANDVVVATKCSAGASGHNTADYFIPAGRYAVPTNSRLALPTYIGLLVSTRCCADCVYCYADRRQLLPGAPLSFPAWRELIDEAYTRRICNLDLLGGDPLADETALQVGLYLISRGICTFLSTKCQITPFIGRRLVDNGILESTLGGRHTVQISVDSVRPALADYLTGTRGYLARVAASIAVCHDCGIKPRLKAVLTSRNWDEVEAIIEYFAVKGVREYQFVQYGISNYKYRGDLFLSATQKSRLSALAASLPTRYSDLIISIQDDRLDDSLSQEEKERAWKGRARCTGGYSSMVVVPTGDVILCEQVPQEPEFVVGNIRSGIEGAWRDDRVDRFLFPPRELFEGTACEECADFNTCHNEAGFCYRDAILAYGTRFDAPPNCPRQTRPGRRLV